MSDDIKARLTELKERLNRTSDLVGDAEVMLEEAEIAMTIEKITGIPVAKMVGDEKQKIMEMEQILKERLIGQDGAIETIAEAVRKSRAGLKRANRPIGSFLFLGPTGVGKTYLAKLLAEFLFNDPSCMIRMDMSEYMEKHNVAKMVGAPAGYVGYEEGGILTDYVRMKPFSVVLFDEIEKAHPDVFNILLQVMDDGRLTDGQGRTIDFSNTLVILTSNYGAEYIIDCVREKKVVDKDQLFNLLLGKFKPELLNRLSELIVFMPLMDDSVKIIVKNEVKDILKLIADKNIKFTLTDAAITKLAADGYSFELGARPIQREIDRHLAVPLSVKLINEEVMPGDTVIFDVVDDSYEFKKQ
jgi:ATP-dependent Clp protease ATP-binding subunit ClpB